jgi:hypothetical protein
MATTPTNSRFPFEPHISKLEPQVQYVIRNLWNSLSDVQGAVPILKSQINDNKSTISTVSKTVNNNISTQNVTTSSSTYPTSGFVNNQTGVTSYSILPSDNSSFLIFNDASPVALTLTTGPSIQLPYYFFIFNEGMGVVTATPSTGTISYPNNLLAASMPIAQGQGAIICYDGTNYFAVIIQVQTQNTPSVIHQWISAYNSITGVFSLSQPAFSDISGIVASSQLPNPTTSTLGGVQANTPVAHEWINSINTSGVPQLSQPLYSDISGAPAAYLTGTTVSMGGSPMTLGQTITATASVPGAATSMAVVVSPVIYSGNGFVWDGYVSAAGTVTARLTCVAAGTPTASVFNVRCIV